MFHLFVGLVFSVALFVETRILIFCLQVVIAGVFSGRNRWRSNFSAPRHHDMRSHSGGMGGGRGRDKMRPSRFDAGPSNMGGSMLGKSSGNQSAGQGGVPSLLNMRIGNKNANQSQPSANNQSNLNGGPPRPNTHSRPGMPPQANGMPSQGGARPPQHGMQRPTGVQQPHQQNTQQVQQQPPRQMPNTSRPPPTTKPATPAVNGQTGSADQMQAYAYYYNQWMQNGQQQQTPQTGAQTQYPPPPPGAAQPPPPPPPQ